MGGGEAIWIQVKGLYYVLGIGISIMSYRAQVAGVRAVQGPCALFKPRNSSKSFVRSSSYRCFCASSAADAPLLSIWSSRRFSA